jgi:hypothetical protein
MCSSCINNTYNSATLESNKTVDDANYMRQLLLSNKSQADEARRMVYIHIHTLYLAPKILSLFSLFICRCLWFMETRLTLGDKTKMQNRLINK